VQDQKLKHSFASLFQTPQNSSISNRSSLFLADFSDMVFSRIYQFFVTKLAEMSGLTNFSVRVQS